MTKLDLVFEKIAKILRLPIEPGYNGAIVTWRNIRIISLRKDEDRFVLEKLLDIAPEPNKPYGKESAERVSGVIKENGLSGETVCNLVTDNELFIRHVEIPEMSEEEIVESLRFSESDSIPFPAETASINVMLVNDEPVDGEMKVLMGALDGPVMEKYHQFFEGASLRHTGITTAPAALLAVMKNSRIIDQTKPVPIISIGGTVTGVYIFSDYDLKFTRDIRIGGRGIAEKLATSYEVDGETVSLTLDEAEEMKDIFGVPHSDALSKAGIKGVTGRMLREKLEPILDFMVAEFGRSIDFFKNENRVNDVPTVYLIGNTAHLKNLPEYLSSALGYEFKTYNPFKDNIDIEDESLAYLKEKGAGMTVPIGLALDRGDTLNLLPKKLRYDYRTQIKRYIPYAAAAAFIIAIGTLFSGGMYYQNRLKSELASLKSEIDSMTTFEQAAIILEGEIVGLKNTINAINARMSILPELSGKDLVWPELFGEISELLPADVALDKIQISYKNPEEYATDGKRYKQQLIIEGKTRGATANQVMLVRTLLEKMKKSETFPHASLISSENREDSDSGDSRLYFKIAADLKDG